MTPKQYEKALAIIAEYLSEHATFHFRLGTYPACGTDLVDYAKWHADPLNINYPWPGVRGES